MLAQDGVKYVIGLKDIDAIGRLARCIAPEDEIIAENPGLVLSQIADAVHRHGMRAFGATPTRYGGAVYYSYKGEQIREAVNGWSGSSGAFDRVMDFNKITRAPANPKRYNSAYYSGDHLPATLQAIGRWEKASIYCCLRSRQAQAERWQMNPSPRSACAKTYSTTWGMTWQWTIPLRRDPLQA